MCQSEGGCFLQAVMSTEGERAREGIWNAYGLRKLQTS